MQLAREREASVSRLLMAFISSGLLFMLLPGTFLGVWNLLRISGSESAGSVSPAWLQAHGHAQVFGWIGSFILGIGFYSIPKLRGAAKPAFGPAWLCWAMWTVGVTARWAANVYRWQWRVMLPVSGVLELLAFLIFFRAVSQHRPEGPGKTRLDPWIYVVVSAALGFLLLLIANLAACVYLALDGATPALSHVLDQRFLTLATWGFLVPFVWGFSTRWMPVFLGLKPGRARLLLGAVLVNVAGVVLTLAGWGAEATVLFVVAAALAIAGIRVFEPAQQEAKTRGVHRSFPFFVRLAYGWLLAGALLGVAAGLWDSSGGIWGASRHALTVGFIAVMVFCVGQRILPAFAGMRQLWSSELMFAGLVLLTIGCTLRVSSEILAYQGIAGWAWSILPFSAMLELAGITAFATNLLGTFLLEPSHAQKQAIVVEIR
ncbi:MAG: NnrS family protein [Acidobacteriia bacterium]|nr:NnrS family protein [Terriglobia bacterium]